MIDLPEDKVIDVKYLWAPEHEYVKDEDGEWVYKDGGQWIASTDVNRPEDLEDPDYDPNKPTLDEEYSYHGTVAGLYEKAKDYEFLLFDEATQTADGEFEILRHD